MPASDAGMLPVVARERLVNGSSRSGGSSRAKSAGVRKRRWLQTFSSLVSTTLTPPRRQLPWPSAQRSSSTSTRSASRVKLALPIRLRNAHQLGEQVAVGAPLRGCAPAQHAALRVSSHDPLALRDGEYQPDPVVADQARQLACQLREVAGLDLYQGPVAHQVDHVAAQRHLGPIPRQRVPALERGVQRPLPQLADGVPGWSCGERTSHWSEHLPLSIGQKRCVSKSAGAIRSPAARAGASSSAATH